ncbi:MAG: hypothetical protein P1V20_03450 [Verrucomicrobiales bacterium]|nr:hypothetical protein [Verrucomicrobiales bacterium]
MKPIDKHINNPGTENVRRLSPRIVIAWVAIIVGVSAGIATGQTSDVQGEQVLTRGPVHEAFAGIINYNPEPGLLVESAPPEAINELPPEMRPEGDNITWIPGYWAWDDERNDFLWISGTWRALPPGREWISGYWSPTTQGYQWTSGYWADSTLRETTYLPRPPETLETGPNVVAPSSDYGWTPGCWVWHQESYAWRAGYWNEGRSDWEWNPAHYVWTPRGYIFVDGFWDYSVARRGILFAPVFFDSRVYSRRDYRYSPTIVISLGAFVEHLFLRPRYSHYYFGDYYASSYRNRGFYSSFAFQSSRNGYDPVYSHQRWEHRNDAQWERRFEASHQYRRDNKSARPPRTWSTQRDLASRSDAPKSDTLVMATPLDQLARGKGTPVKLQTVVADERQRLAQRGHEVQKFLENRRELEVRSKDPQAGKLASQTKPTKVERPGSPIVGKQSNQLLKAHGLPPASRSGPDPNELVRPGSGQVPGNRPRTKVPGTQTVPRMVEPQKGSPGPQQTPGTRPQTKIPVPQTGPREVEPKRGDPRPEQTPGNRPQTKIPIPRTGPRAVEPKRGNPASRPQTKIPVPKTVPGVVEPKRDPRPQTVPGNRSKQESPRPQSEPRKTSQQKGDPGRGKSEPRGRPSQPEIKPAAKSIPVLPIEDSKPKKKEK